MIRWLESISGETWAIVFFVCAGLLVVGLLIALVGSDSRPKVMCICPSCGAFGYPKIVVPGSTLIAILLIFVFVVPAVFYALFRRMGTRRECPLCGNEGMIPADSPKGLQLQNLHGKPPT